MYEDAGRFKQFKNIAKEHENWFHLIECLSEKHPKVFSWVCHNYVLASSYFAALVKARKEYGEMRW